MEGCCGLNWWNFGQKLEAEDSLERFALFYNFDFIFTLDPSQEKRIKAKRGHFRLRNACQQISGYPSPLPPLCQLISAWGRQSEIARYIFHYFPSFVLFHGCHFGIFLYHMHCWICFSLLRLFCLPASSLQLFISVASLANLMPANQRLRAAIGSWRHLLCAINFLSFQKSCCLPACFKVAKRLRFVSWKNLVIHNSLDLIIFFKKYLL